MPQPRRSIWLGAVIRDVLEAVALAAVLFLVLQIALQNTIVDGPSMEPNLQDQQWILVNKLAFRLGQPQRGDVIVFDAPDGSGREFIKRIVALPGETVSVREGQVSIDGAPIDEPWLPRQDRSSYGPYMVPQGQVFVLGDNRANSNDSRVWGGLDVAKVVGRAWLSIWPPQSIGSVPSSAPGPKRTDDATGSP